MAAPQGPFCSIRFVVEHHYAEGVKGGAHPVQVRFFGKRGKPVKKMRLVPAEKASLSPASCRAPRAAPSR